MSKTSGSAQVVSKNVVDVGCDTLPHYICGKELFFFNFFQTQTKQDSVCNFKSNYQRRRILSKLEVKMYCM